MLPKVATTLLHSTSRAAAAVQNQTHTIRNVLQLQSSSPSSGAPKNGPGSSGANWGHNGPSSGGSKYNTGSRFQTGYHGASRAVTQASALAHDGSYTQTDDTDDLAPKRVSHHEVSKKTRLRSHSLSLNRSGHPDRPLGVLKTVQIHARSLQVFAPSSELVPSASGAPSTPGATSSPRPLSRRNSLSSSSPSSPTNASAPPLVRHSSDSATVTSSSEPTFDGISPPPPPPAAAEPNATDPAAPQTTSPPTDPSAPSSLPEADADADVPSSESEIFLLLRKARDTKDATLAAEAVAHFRQLSTTTSPSIQEYNMALDALYATRTPGEPLTLILETYNEMFKHALLPNYRTYVTMLFALTDRDAEVSWAITGIENRQKWRADIGTMSEASMKKDKQLLESYRAETNFASAMSIFQALLAIKYKLHIPTQIYFAILRSCVHHLDIDSAILVWSHIEKRQDYRPFAIMYKYLLQIYAGKGELSGVQAVLHEFRKASQANMVAYVVPGKGARKANNHGVEAAPHSQLAFWNQLIEAYFACGVPDLAIGVVDEMINSTVSATQSLPGNASNSTPQFAQFNPTGVPAPASSTFTTVIAGFCRTGDPQTALAWFERLLAQKSAPVNPFAGTLQPTRPDTIAWRCMIEGLVDAGMVDELNRIILAFYTLKIEETDKVVLRQVDQELISSANMAKIQELKDELTNGADAVKDAELKAKIGEYLKFVDKTILQKRVPDHYQDSSLIRSIVTEYLEIGLTTPAFDLVRKHCRDTVLGGKAPGHAINLVGQTITTYLPMFYAANQGILPFNQAIYLHKLAARAHADLPEETQMYLMHAYAVEKQAQGADANFVKNINKEEFGVLLVTAAKLALRGVGVEEGRAVLPQYTWEGNLLELVVEAESNPEFALQTLHPTVSGVIVEALLSTYPHKDLMAQLKKKLSPLNASWFEQRARGLQRSVTPQSEDGSAVMSESAVSYSTAPTSEVESSRSGPVRRIDKNHSKALEEHLTKNVLSRANPHGTVKTASQMFQDGLRAGKYPTPFTMGRLCQALGRAGDIAGAKSVYGHAQDMLATIADTVQQKNGWLLIEDGMIIALAQAGDIEGAHLHRMRILEQGGAPSADAYGGLILLVRDTTDDTSNAMALYQESQMHGVVPNQYLYNNIISKLAKARKADLALELFSQMKANRIAPSSITYGAVISACAKVGDVDSAEILFAEMVQAQNFKARIPPYNMMMQLYTTTKPNRERALFFFEELLKAGVKPTSYTYKLLMETYVIEPIDIAKVEEVFQTIAKNPHLELQSNHFTTLINAYGCVLHDLDKAIAIFDSIPTYPRAPPLDALAIEAMMNVLAVHRRADLIPEYIAKMNFAGIHMTAYIVNAMIRTYAVVGDLEQARGVFESLIDPPQGVAALHNHAPHDPSASPVVDPMEPVYREPSTWEAMVRAELGAGHRDHAVALLERLKTRQYPEAVYNRISGIMVDHSMIPLP